MTAKMGEIRMLRFRTGSGKPDPDTGTRTCPESGRYPDPEQSSSTDAGPYNPAKIKGACPKVPAPVFISLSRFLALVFRLLARAVPECFCEGKVRAGFSAS